MFDAQGNVCGVCRRDTASGKGWVTDHCHETGKVRGILCDNCNKGLGLLGDNSDGLLSALCYLGKVQMIHVK